jgi:DNA-binding NtrC family response regulator
MEQTTPSILIADDDSKIITALKLLLKAENYQVTTVNSPDELLRILKRRDFSVTLIDLNYQKDTTSGQEGLQLIADIKAINEQLPIVVMTGYSSVDIAVEAMKLGASDFVQKPWGNDRLLAILASQVRFHAMAKKGVKLEQENALLRSEISGNQSNIIAKSQTMQQVLSQIKKLALSEMSILLTGENGCGKSMLADYVHQCSTRKANTFMSVNMGAISESLFESEMFGHVKGAFTDAKENRIGRFELAENGTIFLDEITNISLVQQAKLLRVLEERQFEKVGSSQTQQVDVRLVSATNAELSGLIEQGKFRQDLLYRLNTVEIRIPALRERRADIIPLAEYFLKKFGDKYRLPSLGIDPDARKALIAYDWPGNIRELSHMIERAIFLSQDGMIAIADLSLSPQLTSQAKYNFDLENESLDNIEKHIIVERLQRFNNNGNETAESLGLSRSSYYRRLEKHNL